MALMAVIAELDMPTSGTFPTFLSHLQLAAIWLCHCLRSSPMSNLETEKESTTKGHKAGKIKGE